MISRKRVKAEKSSNVNLVNSMTNRGMIIFRLQNCKRTLVLNCIDLDGKNR